MLSLVGAGGGGVIMNCFPHLLFLLFYCLCFFSFLFLRYPTSFLANASVVDLLGFVLVFERLVFVWEGSVLPRTDFANFVTLPTWVLGIGLRF